MNARNVLTGVVVGAAAGLLGSCGYGVTTYTIGGEIAGATTTVLITLNGTTGIEMLGDGSFTFPNELMSGDTFNVQVLDPSDRCVVANGAGTVGVRNITEVSIRCGAQTTQPVVRSAILLGAAENPAVMTNASGAGGVIVNPSSLAITGGITFSGLMPLTNQIHIHQAPAASPAGNGAAIIALTLAADGLTAIVPSGTVLAADQYASLLAGELYFNVGTAAHPNGEIRGQIETQGGVAASVAALDGTQVIPPVATTASGKGTVVVDRATGKILISYLTHTLANAGAADIHTSAGPASIVAFTSVKANIDGVGTDLANPPPGAAMSTQDLADFDASLLYFNVASTAHSAGEIRGNIAPQ